MDKKTSKAIKYIAIGGVGIWLYKKMQGDSIGKLYDYNPTSGGRIDQYWNGLSDIENYSTNLIGDIINTEPYHLIPENAAKRFNLSGIEFGNWMNQVDRLSHHIAAMQSLNDLATIIDVPPSRLGRNKLAIALGARGKGGALAHYERSSRYTINITKENGAGAFAHEFGHYIDNYISKRFLKNSDFATGGRSKRMVTDPSKINDPGIRGSMERIIDGLYYNDDRTTTDYYDWQVSDGTDYYRRRTEVFARTFEQYVRMKLAGAGIINNYLVNPNIGQDEPPQRLVLKVIGDIEYVVSRAFN